MAIGIPGAGGGNYGITINAKVKGQQNIKRLGNSMQGVQGKAKNLVGAFKGLAKPLTAIALAVGVFKTLKSSFDVLAEREADFATLANGLTRVSTDAPKAAKALRAMADELGFKTLFDEKAFQKGFALLTSFKNIGIDSYGRVAETAADLAQINQVDLKSSFLQLAKALSDPTRGLTALSRSGVIFTEQQREMILELHNSGQQMKAQAEILKIVEGSYKGAARAAATGLAGAFDTLGQKFRDFNEALGRADEPFMEPLVEGATEVFDVVTQGLKVLEDDMEVFAKNISIALEPLFTWLIDNLKNIFNWLDQVFATQRNLAAIRIKTGDEFASIRAKIRDQAEKNALKRFKEEMVIKEGDFKRNKILSVTKQPVFFEAGDPLIGTSRNPENYQDVYRNLKNEEFAKLVEAETIKQVGVFKTIIPKVQEFDGSLKDAKGTLKGLKKGSDDLNGSLDKTFGDHMKTKLDTFKDSIKTVQESMADVVIKGIKGMEDALVDFVMTGKLSFRDLANSMIKDMIRIQIQQSITTPLSNFFSGLFKKNANGNVYGQNGIVPFANGGIVTKPTVFPFKNGIGLMSEKGPEAIMPLKRGKGGRLGVEGGGNNTSVVVNVDASGTDVQGNDQQANQLGRLISIAVQSELIKQRRPGGLLTA